MCVTDMSEVGPPHTLHWDVVNTTTAAGIRHAGLLRALHSCVLHKIFNRATGLRARPRQAPPLYLAETSVPGVEVRVHLNHAACPGMSVL